MRTQVTLARAIGSEFIGRQISGTWWIVAIAAALVIAGSVWLTTLSAWWWILTVIVIWLSSVIAVVYIVAALIVKLARPAQTEAQATEINQFVDKLERMLENVGTPWFIIPFFVAWDMLRGKEDGFLQTVIEDSASLRADLKRLRDLFAD